MKGFGRRHPRAADAGSAASRPRGFEDVPELTDEEVEARIGARVGDLPRRQLPRPVRSIPEPVVRQRRVGRGAVLGGILVVAGLFGVRVFLPDVPATAFASPTPGGTQAAVASLPVRTLAPDETRIPGRTLGPVVDPSLDLNATPAPEATPAEVTASPAPTPAPRPGTTPRPTRSPNPSATPAPIASASPATVTVRVLLANNDGGTATIGDWVVSAGTSEASPSTFTATSSTAVTLPPGVEYHMAVTPQTAEAAGYSAVVGTYCSSATGGVLSAGQQVTCWISLGDDPVQLTVVTNVTGPDPASSWTVSVDGTNVQPSITAPGSATGTVFTVSAHAGYAAMLVSGPSGYDISASTACTDADGAGPGVHVTCTFTVSQQAASPGAALPFLPVVPMRSGPRWRRTRG